MDQRGRVLVVTDNDGTNQYERHNFNLVDTDFHSLSRGRSPCVQRMRSDCLDDIQHSVLIAAFGFLGPTSSEAVPVLPSFVIMSLWGVGGSMVIYLTGL